MQMLPPYATVHLHIIQVIDGVAVYLETGAMADAARGRGGFGRGRGDRGRGRRGPRRGGRKDEEKEWFASMRL